MTRRLILGVAVAALVASSLSSVTSVTAADPPPGPSPSPTPSRLDPGLAAALTTAASTDQVSVIVHFRDIDRLPRGRGSRETVEALRSAAELSHRELRPRLDRWQATGEVRGYTRLWIRNAIAVTARPAVVDALARAPGVVAVVPDRIFRLEAARPRLVRPATNSHLETGSPPEGNIDLIRAPLVWALGATGTGVVVASVDTGVDASHPDLAGSFRGGTNSWYDPNGQHPSAPIDVNGHGTMTTGLIVGGDAGGTAIGVAPGAQWIAVKLFADNGTGTTTNVHLAFQWLLDPDGDPLTEDAPDIVNNSWSAGPACSSEFDLDLAAFVAAGIVPVFAAGNGGPRGSVETPASDPSSFSVGASSGDTVSAFSSRGPTSCGRTEPAIAPDVVGPGENVWTTDRTGLYAQVSGTSMAAPHVTGTLALLRGAFPNRSIAELEDAIRSTAVDLPPVGPDNAAGYGRVDVLAAYEELAGGPTPTPTPAPTPTPPPTPSPTPAATPTDTVGPQAIGTTVVPSLSNGASISVGGVIDDSTTGGSAVVAAEAFVDTVAAPGSGIPMAGSFGGSIATVSGTIPPALLAGLADGAHEVILRGRDAVAGWGPATATTFILDRTAPAATAPGQSLATGVSLSAGRVPIRLAWTGSDATSGVDRYEVRQQVDRGTWTTLGPAVPTGRAWPRLAPGHTYRFGVRPVDRAGNAGAWTYGPTFRVGGYSETSSAVRYSGAWSTVANASFWGGRARASSIRGARATFTTTGNGAAWVSVTGPTRGRATVWVDGRLVATVDLYAPRWSAGQVVWAANWSVARRRHVEIRAVGTSGRPRVDIDGFLTW